MSIRSNCNQEVIAEYPLGYSNNIIIILIHNIILS
nr:MAG TPA: hypothetical protein [Caudoviricetes sp.]